MAALTLLVGAASVFLGCASLRREFAGDPAVGIRPKIEQDAPGVGEIIKTVVPAPWAALALAVLGATTAISSAVATHRAEKATRNAPAAWNTAPPQDQKPI